MSTLSPRSCEVIEEWLLSAKTRLTEAHCYWQINGVDYLDDVLMRASGDIHRIRSELAYSNPELKPDAKPTHTIDELD